MAFVREHIHLAYGSPRLSLHSYRGIKEDVNLRRYCHSRVYRSIVLTANMRMFTFSCWCKNCWYVLVIKICLIYVAK